MEIRDIEDYEEDTAGSVYFSCSICGMRICGEKLLCDGCLKIFEDLTPFREFEPEISVIKMDSLQESLQKDF